MIYFVSGFMRSFTSMMMACLRAGGLDPVYSRSEITEDGSIKLARTAFMNTKFGDHDPVKRFCDESAWRVNPEFYEPDAQEFTRVDFPHCHEGRLLKVLYGGITKMAPKRPGSEGYRVIFMRRPQAQIKLSFLAGLTMGKSAEWHALLERKDFDQVMDRIIADLRDRKSFASVHEIWSGDVFADPKRVFRYLADQGWPIDPERAAAAPDKTKIRFGT